jgi:uncharacterized SAM-binding protein YcdF (DUF218 family)
MLLFDIKTYLSPWLLPPVSLFLLVALGLLMAGRWPRLGRTVAAVAVLAGIALSMPLFADRLMALVEAPYAELDRPPLRLPEGRQAAWRAKPDQAPQAIVVLSGGLASDGAESGQRNRVSPGSLERVLHARRLARLTALPLLVSGGVTAYGGEPEARLLRDLLEGELGTPVKWIETKSRDTAENAGFTRDILQPLGIRRILLVTHAYHMRRAQAAFERAGFAVTPAPHSFMAGPVRFSWLQLVPTLEAVSASRLALRELIGQAWYRLVALVN